VTVIPEAGARRTYDGTRRRAQAAATRERIVAAGAELLRNASIRDWRGLTIRAVAGRADVHERTVYRHFANERALRDAVMHRLEQDAGVDLAHMALGDVGAVAANTLRYVSAHHREPRRALDPTLDEAKRRQHDALRAAVGERGAHWSDGDRTLAAAVLDVLWAVGSYERLVADWHLESEDAIRGLTWAIGLVGAAVEGGRPPRSATTPGTRRRSRGGSAPRSGRGV
jgi:AcrR family transcriptional regulator